MVTIRFCIHLTKFHLREISSGVYKILCLLLIGRLSIFHLSQSIYSNKIMISNNEKKSQLSLIDNKTTKYIPIACKR